MVLPFSFLVLTFSGCATAPYHPAPMAGVPGPTAGIYHEVASGDTLWRIARTYDIDLADVVKANNLSDATKINPGQQLFIPHATRSLLVTTPKEKLYESDLFVWPLEGEVIDYFGQEVYGTRNKGIDIQAKAGAEVIASKSGKVVFCSDKVKGLGKVIILDHLDGFSTVYARNSQNLVKVGDHANQNQVIAMAGSTGRGAKPYLHFEIRRHYKPQNPLYYLP